MPAIRLGDNAYCSCALDGRLLAGLEKSASDLHLPRLKCLSGLSPAFHVQINSSHPGFVPISNHENDITIPSANEKFSFVHKNGRIPSVGSIVSKIGHRLWFC